MDTRSLLRRRLGVVMAAWTVVAGCTACAPSTPEQAPRAPGAVTGGGLTIGDVIIRGTQNSPLHRLGDGMGYTNGTDTFYTANPSGGGTFVLYRYTPSAPTVMANPYPEIVLPGTKMQYAGPVRTSPFYQVRSVKAPFDFATPYKQLKWPALLTDAGVGLFLISESPLFEEAIEPFVSAYPAVRGVPNAEDSFRIRFAEAATGPAAVTLGWTAVAHTSTTTTYVAQILDPAARVIALRLPRPYTTQRVWYMSRNNWTPALTESGASHDPGLLLVHTENPTQILVESVGGSPASRATVYTTDVGYVERARWAAFTVYQGQNPDGFFNESMASSMKAYNDRLFALRDTSSVRTFSSNWRDLLQLAGFTDGKNLLNPKFFNMGFPAAADPLYEIDPNVKESVSWVTDEAALQAVMGSRLFGFSIDPRYAEGVKVFYDPIALFYSGAYKRANGKFTSADTGGDGVVIGYNYLLSLTRLTELIGTQDGLPPKDVQGLVDRVLPLLQAGYIDGYSQIPYLWAYPPLSGLQWEYGMGKELSEAQLSYICGLWWLRTNESRYRDCETSALRLPEELALRLRGSSFLWGLDVVHGAYVLDALLLAYRTTQAEHYLDAALQSWREELLFLFSNLDYPETYFDDRAMAVTSFTSTFADLHQGNTWRGDSWNNARTLWSLSKLLAYTDDVRIVHQLEMANETHKQNMPVVDAVYNATQQSDFYNLPIDPNDFELNYEALRNHYSTQISFSTDIWREAFMFASIHASTGSVFRIPGPLITDSGLAYVAGKPDALVNLTIDARDCAFADGSATTVVRLDSSGVARVPLISRQVPAGK